VGAEWKASFVAVSVLLGQSLEEALGAIEGPDEVAGTALVMTLRSATRDARARAIAGVLAGLVSALPSWEAD
jgi:hypothetical protein